LQHHGQSYPAITLQLLKTERTRRDTFARDVIFFVRASKKKVRRFFKGQVRNRNLSRLTNLHEYFSFKKMMQGSRNFDRSIKLLLAR
jgi:hypothetical protein